MSCNSLTGLNDRQSVEIQSCFINETCTYSEIIPFFHKWIEQFVLNAAWLVSCNNSVVCLLRRVWLTTFWLREMLEYACSSNTFKFLMEKPISMVYSIHSLFYLFVWIIIRQPVRGSSIFARCVTAWKARSQSYCISGTWYIYSESIKLWYTSLGL